MIFVLDENVPLGMMHIILAHNRKHQVRRMVEDLDYSIGDIDWIEYYASLEIKPYIVGGDRLRHKHEKPALRGSGLTYIFLDGWQSVRWEVSHWRLLRAWVKVVDILPQLSGPHIVRLNRHEELRFDAL